MENVLLNDDLLSESNSRLQKSQHTGTVAVAIETRILGEAL